MDQIQGHAFSKGGPRSKENGPDVLKLLVHATDIPINCVVARQRPGFDPDHDRVTGTEILTAFPLRGNPLDGGGTVLTTATFTGELVKP
jgi:hypothetical protein